MLKLELHYLMGVCDAGCCEGHGKIPCAESACCHKDVWPEVSAAGCVTADCGALILPGMPHFLTFSFACASEATCRVMETCLKVHCDTVKELQGTSLLSIAVLLAQTLKSTQAMADAMRGATKAMGAMNKQMNLPALTKIMREFERQNEKMEMTSEMMGDAVDDAFEVEPRKYFTLHASCI